MCAKTLRDQSRFMYIAEAVFMLFRDSMESDTARLIRDYASVENEEDRKKIVAQQVKSVFPVNILNLTDDPENQRLEALVQEYSEVNLADVGSESD